MYSRKFAPNPKGRKPFLQVMIDLATLEKCGKFKEFKDLITVITGNEDCTWWCCIVGKWRIPWACVWRGIPLTCTVGIETGQVLTQT